MLLVMLVVSPSTMSVVAMYVNNVERERGLCGGGAGGSFYWKKGVMKETYWTVTFFYLLVLICFPI